LEGTKFALLVRFAYPVDPVHPCLFTGLNTGRIEIDGQDGQNGFSAASAHHPGDLIDQLDPLPGN
jgi:hypothetical protein